MDIQEDYEDHYATLQLNPNADPDTIQRVFRLLAKRYHPDNHETGNPDRFNRLVKAYEVLSHATERARYDARYFANRSAEWKVFDRNTNGNEEDKRIFQAVLSMLYLARRQNARHPGLGIIQIEKMLGCPSEYIEFHIWYLKEKQWIERTENGQLAITVAGVERVCEGDYAIRADRLLAQQVHDPSREPEKGADSSSAMIGGHRQ